MPLKPTIQSTPPYQAGKDHIWWKWFNDVYVLISGKEGRQNFINTLVNAVSNNQKVRNFFVNYENGDAKFTDPRIDPYLLPDGTLAAPVGINTTRLVAVTRSIENVGAVSAFQTSGQATGSGNPETLIFDTIDFDEDNAYDAGTGTWLPTQAGKYNVTVNVGFDAADVVANCRIYSSILLNGNAVAITQAHTSLTEDITAQCSVLLDMDGLTDSCTFTVFQNFGAAANTSGTRSTVFFCAFKVD